MIKDTTKAAYQAIYGGWIGDENSLRKRYLRLAADLYDADLGSNVVIATTVTELEAAKAAQSEGQTIMLAPGKYDLTESLTILLAGTYGGILGIGSVQINGHDDADEAILIDPAVASGTFGYSLENLSIKGGSGKKGLHVLNTSTAKKVNVYLNQVDIEDNGAGKALTIVNSDVSNAIRVYANRCNIDGIAHTPKNTGDRLRMDNCDLDQNLVAAVVDVVATYFFSNCKIPHEGITGGHANNVISFVNCRTEETPYVPVAVDSDDCPGAFDPDIFNPLIGARNQIGNAEKTSYNRVTGFTKFDNRPSSVSAEAYTIQVRGYNNATSGEFKGVDAHVYLRTNGSGYLRGSKGVAMVDSGVTATGSWIIGASGMAVVDGVMAGASYLVGLSGAIEASNAPITAALVTSCWLDSQQNQAVTGVHNLLNMTNNGAAVMDEAIRVHAGGKITNLLALNSVSGMVSASKATGSASKIKITVNGSTRYINIYELS